VLPRGRERPLTFRCENISSLHTLFISGTRISLYAIFGHSFITFRPSGKRTTGSQDRTPQHKKPECRGQELAEEPCARYGVFTPSDMAWALPGPHPRSAKYKRAREKPNSYQ
jgi:hypothetical protein